MAFLPSLQETVQSHTGGFLFFRAERIQDKSSEGSINPDLPLVRHGSLEAGLTWGRNNALGYSSLFESMPWKTKATSSTILYESLPSKFSSGEEPWETWSSYAFTSLGSQEKQQIGRGVSAFISWQPHSKIWEGYYKLVLDLQDLLLVGQIWREHVFLAASYPSTEVQPLEQLFDIRKPTEVTHFLEENPFLTPLLREAYSHLRKYFQSSKLFLEVVADPELIDEEQLVVFIAVNHDPDEASEALNRLDKDWWLDAMERAQDKLTITLEFQ
jgi:hypothetical protein